MQSRAIAKVVFRGTCFKCGMRGHKADRCRQKGKGKGGKGDWKTVDQKERDGARETGQFPWDRSWHHSNWYGKTYGLEVAAVRPVPYLCAVSLNSSCEEFSEPKHMTRGTRTKTSQSGSQRILFI